MLPTENPWPAMIVLLSIAAFCLVQGLAGGKTKTLVLGVIFILAAGGCYLLDLYVETPREIVTRNVYELTSAFQHQDVPKTLSFFSPQAKERGIIETMLKGVRVKDDLRLTDLSVSFKAADSLAISHFRANASLSVDIAGFQGDLGYHPSRWELDWQKEAGEWKIVKVHRLNPINGKEIPFLSGD